MSDVNRWWRERSVELIVPAPKDFGQVANELREKALEDAKAQLHPLLRDAQLDRLDERPEFVKTFSAPWNRGLPENWQLGPRVSRLFFSSMKRGWKPPNPGMVPFIYLLRCLACLIR